ncbi:LuxR family transcriptional regulator [Sandaracinobacter neustonicus]|uniref:LuxR family transcriptional regulator n=1 Tax=Sandaracinobacter neustonicus TaxID=1715348 RepID=A0A501XR62_9SPHN|nr:LuxR family transcriptional regulator [Sandaracinobacter neustonicus]TPE62597.1 LuxR family transcriptional regulator [Sandaracinobacter neustonicus]
MPIPGAVKQLVRIAQEVETEQDLEFAMAEVTRELGFRYYALSHHVDFAATPDRATRLHNYPESWQDYYDRHRLGVSDPVHRASHVTSVGFCWSRIPEMIALTPADRAMLSLGRDQGIGNGFTVPAHVPGESRGSCSFASDAGGATPAHIFPIAQLAGNFAFEAARRLWLRRGQRAVVGTTPLTDRQRDCALWVARGKGDWEIARILGVSEETVAQHVRQACGRYGVNKRTLLLVQTLFDGTLTLTDIFRR